MRLLTFQARRFWWKSFSRTLADAPQVEDEDKDEVQNAVVAFVHVDVRDAHDRPSVVRQTLKHLKWLANKRGLRNIVLHSFTHLGGTNAEPEFARELFAELRERLESTGYAVAQTPFGYFCEWDLRVFGESLAKVYKEI